MQKPPSDEGGAPRSESIIPMLAGGKHTYENIGFAAGEDGGREQK